MSAAHPVPLVAALAFGVALALTACGGSATSAPTAVVASSATSEQATTSPPGGSPSTDPAGSCPGTSVMTDALASTAGVSKVSVIGGCHEVSVETTLTPGVASFGAALTICDKAATAAYANGLLGVTVDAQDGSELAAGVKGSQCIGG